MFCLFFKRFLFSSFRDLATFFSLSSFGLSLSFSDNIMGVKCVAVELKAEGTLEEGDGADVGDAAVSDNERCI